MLPSDEIRVQCPQLPLIEREDLACRITVVQLRIQAEALLAQRSDAAAAVAIELSVIVDGIETSLG